MVLNNLRRMKTSIDTQKESKKEIEKERSITPKNHAKALRQGITPNSMTYRDTAYLKIYKYINKYTMGEKLY